MLRSFICQLLVLGLLVPQGLWMSAAQAQEAAPPAADNTAAGLNLDLGSTDRSVAASTVLSSTASATINLGGLNRVVSAADMLTAAEFVAVRQVMNTGTQYLQLNDLGAAIGGGMRLNANLAGQINSLVIPTNVHASQNAAVLQTLNLAGNFTNSGIYSIMSTNSAVTSAAINASNIYNNAGASIQSTLANLTLNAVNNIVNAGMISSAGNLNMTAGGSISNMGQLAVMQAMNNMNLQAANIVNQGTMLAQLGNMNAVTANLTNSGAMQSLSQSLMVQNLTGSVLNVNSAGGVMSALKDLSFITQGPQYDELGKLLTKPAINLQGGVLSGENVNFTTPDGGVHVHAQRIDGGVNIFGGAANLGVDSGNLRIASQTLTGDPIYYNDGGDLDLSGVINPSYFYTRGDFVALASGNINALTISGNAVVDGSSLANVPGGSIVIASGVDITVNNSGCNPCIAGTDYIINGPSATGGNVVLPMVAFVTNTNDITIQASGGCIGCTNAGSVSVNSVSAPGANVVITADSDVTLGSLPSAGGANFSITSGGNITPFGSITAAGDVVLQTTGNGNINLRNPVTAFNSIQLTAAGTGTINQTQTYGVVNGQTQINRLNAPSVIFSAGTGDIGSALLPIQMVAYSVSANTAGNVYLNDLTNGSVLLGASSAGAAADFMFANNRHITTTGVISGGDVRLDASGESGTIDLQDDLSASGSLILVAGLINNEGTMSASSIALYANRNLAISGSGNMVSATIDLNASSGGSVVASQNSMVGTVSADASNFLVHLENPTGFVMGSLSPSQTVNTAGPDFFGGTTYYAGNFSQVFDSGGLIVLSTNAAGPTISATIDGSHNITGTLTVSDTLDGDMVIFMRDTLTGDLSVTGTGQLVVSNNYAPLTIQSLDSDFNTGSPIAKNIVVTAGGDITSTGTINGGLVQLNTYSGSISIGDNITAGSVYLFALGTAASGNITQTGGVITDFGGGEVVAMSNNGGITLPSLDTSSLVMFAKNDIDVTSLRTSFTFLDLGVSTGGGNLSITSGASIWVDNIVSAGSINLETTANGGIAFGGMIVPDVYAGTTISLTTAGSGSITSSANAIFAAPTVQLTTDSGSIGSSTEKIVTNTATVQVVMAAGSDAYVVNRSGLPVALDSTSIGSNGLFEFTADSDMSVTGGLTGNNVTLQTTNISDGSINVASNITAAGTLTLTTYRWGGITQPNNVIISTAPTISLNTGLGNVGTVNVSTSVIQPLRINTANLQTHSDGFFSSMGIGLGGDIAIGEWQVANVSANLNLSGNGAALGNPFVLSTTGNITVLSGSTITGGGHTGPPIGDTGVKITASGSITIESGASVQDPISGGNEIVELYTPHLTNNGVILTGDNIIISNPSGNLIIDGTGSISIIVPNAGVGIEGFIQLIGGPGASVSVQQGSINGFVVSGTANFGFGGDTVTDTSPLPTSYSVTVDTGVLRINHIVASGLISLTNNSGDIGVLELTGSQAIVKSTTGSITFSVDGSSRVFVNSGYNPAVIDAANNLTITAGYFSNNSAFVLNAIEHIAGQFYDYLTALPGVHAVNTVTIQNPSGNLVVSGTGGIWTGTGTASSGSFGTIGTGTINFLATSGSVDVNQQLLMGTVNATASTGVGNAGIILVSVGLPAQYSFDTPPPGLPPPGTVSPSPSFTQGTFTYNIPTMPCSLGPCVNTDANIGAKAIWAAPSAMTAGDLLVLSQAVSATPLSPTDVIYIAADGVQDTGGPFGDAWACGSCFANDTFNGTAEITALQPGLMIVHTLEPITSIGNMTISNGQGGGLIIDTGSFGSLQTDASGTYDMTVNSGPGNLVVNATGAGVTGSYNTNFIREVVASGAMTFTNSGGDFINNGATYQGGSVSLSNANGRLLTGFVTATTGNVSITNSGGSLDVVGQYQIQMIDSAGDVSITNLNGDIYINGAAISGGNSFTSSPPLVNISLSVNNGTMLITDSSVINIGFFSVGDIDLSYGNGTVKVANLSEVRGRNVTVTSTGGSSNQMILQAGQIIADNGTLTVNNSGDIMLINGGVLGGTSTNVVTVTNSGNIFVSGGGHISSSGDNAAESVTVVNSGGNITLTDVGSINGSFAGDVIVSNSGGDILVTNAGYISSFTSNVTVTNTSGSITISKAGGIAPGCCGSAEGSVLVTNSGGLVTVDTLVIMPLGGGFQLPNLQAGQTVKVVNDQDIVITGPGYESLLAPGGITLISTGGSVNVSQRQITSTINGFAEDSFSVSTTISGLTVGTVYTNADGLSVGGSSINLVAGTSTLSVVGAVVSNLGSVTLQNASGGFVSLGANSLVAALNGITGFNNVYIVSGAIPNSFSAGTAPGNLSTSTSGGGQILYGSQSITAIAPTNYATAIGGRINFSSSDTQLITMNGNATINNSTPGLWPLISSLDLKNDPTAVSHLLALQAAGLVGGTLQTSGGVATGGNAIIAPANLELSLSAEYIPASVTITMQGFNSSNIIDLQITGASTTNQVVISGTQEFVSSGGNSNPTFNITSNQAGPVLLITAEGKLTSDNTLTLSANGDMSLNGLVQATNLTLSTTNGGDVTGSNPCGTCVVNATTLTLDVSGDVGTVALLLPTQVSNITGNVGNLYMNNFGNLTIDNIRASGTFHVVDNGDITLNSFSRAQTAFLQTISGNGNFTLNDTLQTTGNITVMLGGSGNFVWNNGELKTNTANTTLTMSTDTGDIGSSLQPFNINFRGLAAFGANVYIFNNHDFVLESSAADNHSGTFGTFQVTGSGTIDVAANAIVYGGTVSLTDGNESTVAAGAVVESFGDTGSVTWKTSNFLHNNGDILGHHVLINSDFDLNVDGTGTIGINDMKNSGSTFNGPQSIVSLVSLSGGNVTVDQGRIDGLVSSSNAIQGAFSFACFCFAASFPDDATPPTNFNVTVAAGALYANHINATTQINLTNNGGDIRIYGKDGWSPATVATSGSGDIALTTAGSYTILLDRGAKIDSSNNLTMSTSYFYNNTSPIFMSGNPAVHAVNDITIQNLTGDLGISGTGGMWTGNSGSEGTGTINFNAPNNSVIATSAVLMGTVNISASTTSGLFLLDLAASTNFTAGTMTATAPIGFPSPFSATYGTTGITYWQAPSSMNMIDPSPTQGGGLLVLSTVVAVDPSAPSGDTMNVLINGDPVVGGPAGVTFPVSCGGSCANYTGSGMEVLSTLDVQGLQTGLMVVHANMPVTVDGNTSITNTGGTFLNTSTVGVLQTCNLCAGPAQPGISINTDGGNLVAGGGRGGFSSQPNLVTLGALSITNSGGNFIEYGLVQGGSVSIIGSSTRLFSGDIQSTAGDFVINNSGQIDIFNMAATGGGASVTHAGAGYIDMNFSSIVSGGNLSAGNVSVSVVDATATGGLFMRMGSNIFSNSGGAVNITITNGTIQTHTGAFVISSGQLNVTCTSCQTAPVFNNSTLASFDHLSIVNSNGNLTFNASSIYTSNADIDIDNLNGNLSFNLPFAVRADQLISVDTIFGPFPYSPYRGGNLTVINLGGDLNLSNGALLTGSTLIDGNVYVVNGGGNVNLSGFAGIQSPGGRVIVRNDAGSINVSGGANITANGNGSTADNNIMIYNTGGSVNIDTLPLATALQSPGFAVIVNDQDVNITGAGVNVLPVQHLTVISTGGAVSISQQDMSTVALSGQAGSNFTVSATNGGLLIETILANNGSVALTAANPGNPLVDGSITINPGATIVANNGTVTIETCATGTIQVGLNAFITALNGPSAFNNIYLVSGPIPTSPVSGTTPANVVTSASAGGQIYFGSQGLTALAPNNFVNAIGGNVVFDASNAADISFGGNVTINASTAGVSPLLTSLDLQNDSAVVDQVVALQGLGLIGGVLQTSGGSATGGNAIVSASRIAPLLTALNIPASVTVTFSDFGSVFRPVTISLTAASTTTQAIVSGSADFTDSNTSNVYINVQTDQAGPAVLVNSTGIVTSDQLLSISSNEAISMNGTLSAANNNLILQTTENNADIALAGDVTGGIIVRIQAQSGGNITQTAGTVYGNTVYLLSGSGNIGASDSRVSLQSYDLGANSLYVQTGGNAYAGYLGDVSLERTVIGDDKTLDLVTTCNGSIIINGDNVLGGTINLTADGAGGIFETFNNQVFQADTINLTSGTGDIGGPNGPSGSDLVVGIETGTITANTGGNVYIQMNFIILCLGCPSGTSDLRPQPPASQPTTLNVGSSHASTVLHISTGNLGLSILDGANITVAGDLGSGTLGDLTLSGSNSINFDVRDMTIGVGATIDMAGDGVITLNANGPGTMQNNGQVTVQSLGGSSIGINASSIDGTGSLSGALFVNGGTVSLIQGSIDGLVSGTSFGGDFSVTVDAGLLLVGAITSANNINLTNLGADIYLDNGSSLDANLGTGSISLVANASSSIVVRAGSTFNADTVNFRMAVFQSAVLVNAATAINFNNTFNLTVGSYAGLTAPDVRFTSDLGTVVVGLPVITGNLTVSAPQGATLVAIADITNITSTVFTDGVTPYAPVHLVDTSGVDIYYDPSAIAQTFAGNSFIVLNAGPAPASVSMGSPILAGTITGDLIINNTDGDLVIYNNISGVLTITGDALVTNSGGDLTFTGLGGGSTTWAAGNNLSVTNTAGNLTYNLQFGMQGGNQLQIDNQSGNTFIGFNSTILSNGFTSVSNAGGNLHIGNVALIGGFGTGNTTLINSGGVLSCINCSMQTGPNQVLSLTNLAGDIFTNQAQLTVNPGIVSIETTNGNILLTNNSSVFQGGSAVGQQIDITVNSSGNLTVSRSSINGDKVNLFNLGSGDITVTNRSQVLSSTTVQINSDSGDIVLKNTALVNNSSADINFTTTGGGNLIAGNGFSSTATSGDIVFNTSGNVNIGTGAGFTSTAGNILLANTGNDVVIDTTPFAISGVLPLNPSTLVSLTGNVSISTGQVLSITGSGNTQNTISAAGAVSLVSTTGSVSVLQNVLTSTITGTADTTFTMTATNSSLNVGNISTNPGGVNPNGSITLIAGCVCPPAAATTLTVTANSIITARKGNVILRNADVTQGSIFLDTNSEVNARQLGSSFGNVYIVVGTIPANPVSGTTPANVISNPTLGGQVFYGGNGITGNAPDNTVNAPGTTVVFDAPSSGVITMNGNVQINSVPVIVLTSLDLTDPTVTGDILALIVQGDIGGNLIVNGSGVATGGSILITPGVLSVTITAENIPQNVTIQFQGYSASDPLAINITGASTTKQVVISGTHEYIAGVGASDGVISVTSDQAGPVFQITGTGTLISDGNLTVTTTGGDFSSAGNIYTGGTASITSDAGVILNNLSAGSTVAVTAQAGSITQTGFTDASFTGANGNGANITYQATTGISGVSLNATGGIASGNGGTIIVNTTGGAIAFSSFIDSSARGSGRAGDVTLTADTDITIHSVNAVGGQTPNVNARGGDILIQSNTGSLIATGTTPRFVDSSGSVFFSGTGVANAGTITVTSPGGIVGTGGALSFRAEGGHDGGNGAAITINTNGSAELDFVSSSASTVSPTPTAAGDAADISIIAPGGITMVDARAQGGTAGGSGGNVTLHADNAGVNVSLFVFTNALGPTGNAGFVDISGDSDIVVGNTGGLSIIAFGGSSSGNSNTVTVGSVNGLVNISGLINTSVTTAGNAGAISLDAQTGILSGGLSAAGGTVSGDGANVTATTATGDIAISSFVSSRAKGQGEGGDVLLSAIAGKVAVLGTIGTGAAIAANGGGTGSAGRVDILYGSTSPFVIDAAGVGITNGAKGNMTALATGSGNGNVMTIQNAIDDTVVTLNGTMDVSSVSGTAGSIWFVGTPTISATITGNTSGIINGQLLGSGDNFTLTLLRPDTSLLIGAVNAANQISITANVGTSSINIPVGANITADGAGVTLTAPTIVNDGLISALTGVVTLNNTGSLSVTGTGTITAPTINFNSTTNSVSVVQGTITGTISGTATTNFAVTTSVSSLAANVINATVNSITLTAAGALSVVGNGVITAGQNVSLTGGTGVTIGGGVGTTVLVSAGIVGGALNEFSLDMNAYTYSQIASPGGILITSTTGDIVTNNGVTLDAFGGSVGLSSANDLTFGAGNEIFSQGANVWMQASDNLTIPDGTFTSVARYIPGTVTIDSVNTQNFTGGGIAIFAGVSLPDYNAYLKTTAVDDRVQSDTGTYVNNGATVIGGGVVLENGAWVGLEVPTGGVLNLTNVVLAADGGVISIDPPGFININNAIFGAIGPAIIPVPQPPAPQAQQQVPAAQNFPFLGGAGPGNAPVNLPPDGSAIQTDVSDMASPVEKNASQQMSRTAQIEQVTTQSAAWVFVSGNCQPFLAQSDDSLLFGCGGTMFANNEKTGGVTMREGRLVMLTANKSLKVETQMGDVTIPTDSAGIIEQKPNGVFRLVSLSGQDAQVVLKHGNDVSNVVVRPGEELVVADADMSEEDLIPVDGVDRMPIAGTIAVSGLQAKKSQYDKKQMFEREQLIHCSMGSTMLANYKRRVAKLKDEMTGTSGKAISSAPGGNVGSVVPLDKKNEISTSDQYRKISYEKPESTKLSASSIHSLTNEYGSFKYVGGANLSFEQQGVVNLSSGDLLVASTKATVVRCGEHLISVDPGAVALVSNENGFIRVSNLFENSVNAVRACTSGKMISLTAGKQLMMGPSSEHVTRALGADPIARRRSMYFDLPGGKGASRCEISLVSLLQNVPVLTNLLKSADADDRVLKERLIKMAACLAQTTSTHGPYTTINGEH